MNYIVFDLEFNQKYPFKRESKNDHVLKCPFEIIQIGAVKLNKDFQTISTFNEFIKPKLYITIHPLVKKITGITEEKLNTAKYFNDIYIKFRDFIGDKDNILCVWGMADIKELFRNTKYYNLDTNVIPENYINIQNYASKYLNSPKGTNVGLSNAIKLLNLPIHNEFHDAFNDACYTAEVFKKIFDTNIKPRIYNANNSLRRKKLKNKAKGIDTNKLFLQFEKMYDRKMDAEEKSIIKLAYTMGRTKQFEIESFNSEHNKKQI